MTLDLSFESATLHEFEALLAVRIEAMRDSLESIGRFDAARVRQRFESLFEPEQTRHIVLAAERVGFMVVKPRAEGLLLDHLYLRKAHQGRGASAVRCCSSCSGKRMLLG